MYLCCCYYHIYMRQVISVFPETTSFYPAIVSRDYSGMYLPQIYPNPCPNMRPATHLIDLIYVLV